MNIAFIGAGNMAEAILGGLLESGVARAEEVMLSDVSEERLEKLSQSYDVNTTLSNEEACAKADVVILAVKPQVMESVLTSLDDCLSSQHLVISIAAGLTSAWLDQHLPGGPRILRVMPNTPALVKEGMSCIARGARATEDDVSVALNIFQAVGQAVEVDDAQMDAVTAVSGSGPAYVFYLMEHMEAAAQALGLSPELGKTLVAQTLRGASLLGQNSEEDVAELRRRVTSKGGTTEAAIRTLDEGNAGKVIQAAVQAAAARSRELSGS